MNSCETNFRANRVKAQCETCPLNRIEAGVVVRIKKLQSLRHHFDGLSNLRRRLACQLVPIPFDTCVHILATLWWEAVSKHPRDPQRHLAFFVPNLESNAENQISSAEEP